MSCTWVAVVTKLFVKHFVQRLIANNRACSALNYYVTVLLGWTAVFNLWSESPVFIRRHSERTDQSSEWATVITLCKYNI